MYAPKPIARDYPGDRTGTKPEKMAVLEVFQRERRLSVPLFQRAYVWNREDQWEPLWEDILRQANMHLAQTDPRAIRTRFPAQSSSISPASRAAPSPEPTSSTGSSG